MPRNAARPSHAARPFVALPAAFRLAAAQRCAPLAADATCDDVTTTTRAASAAAVTGDRVRTMGAPSINLYMSIGVRLIELEQPASNPVGANPNY